MMKNDRRRLIRRTSLPLLAALVVAVAVFPRSEAHGQLMVDLKFEKNIFVAYEPIQATVTVMNRAGQDVVLAGPNRSNWLSFEIQRSNELVPPNRRVPSFKPFLLKAGETTRKTIPVNAIYSMGDYGTYTVRASVYLPTFGKFYSSAQKKINVTSGTEVWKQGFGRRNFESGSAELREYALLTHQTGKTSELYIRVRDQERRAVLATYSLGKLVNMGEPQVTLDHENRLHVLHMGAPRAYAHTIIDGEGELVKQELYKDGARNKPSLKINQAGGVRVEGGIPLDPTKRAEIVDDAAKKMVRRASERPSGLPNF